MGRCNGKIAFSFIGWSSIGALRKGGKSFKRCNRLRNNKQIHNGEKGTTKGENKNKNNRTNLMFFFFEKKRKTFYSAMICGPEIIAKEIHSPLSGRQRAKMNQSALWGQTRLGVCARVFYFGSVHVHVHPIY